MTCWVRYAAADGRTGFGTLEGERIAEFRGDLFGRHEATGGHVSAHAVRLLSPCEPSKVVALWNNFHALAAKLGKAAPAHPLYLIKPSTSLAGPADDIRRPARYAGKIAYEGELGIVIGKTCCNVSPQQAGDFIFGYTCVNDVTAAELLQENPDFPQWCRSKGFDTFSVIGPGIVTQLDLTVARVKTLVDGSERQNYPLSDMIFAPHELVSRISGDMTLLPGDVIACGTSVGVGSIKDGATVAVSVDGIGTLSNRLSPA